MDKIRRVVNNRKFIFICTLLVMAFVLIFNSITVYGDVGNSVSRSNSSSSNSSGGDDDGGLIWFLFLLIFKYPVIGIPLLIIFLVFRKQILNGLKRTQQKTDMLINNKLNNTFKNSYANNNIQELLKNDPNFSVPNFITKVNNMYMQLQDAWTKKDWKPIRAFETDELFNMHARQLQRYIDNNETNVVENICILNTEIVKYEQDAVNDIITVRLETRINDYVIDDFTKKVKVGDPNQEIFMTYHWKLIRRKGVLTKVNNQTNTVTQCPNCGANVSINASGECEYCGSIISNGQYDWVLYSIETVGQY